MARMLTHGYWVLLVLLSTLTLFGCGEDVDRKVTVTGSLQPAMTDFPNDYLLVSADSLQSVLGDSGLIVIDARSPASYATSHIPGAINVQHSDYWNAGVGLKDLVTLEAQLGGAGITPGAQIVVYDDTTASKGAAGRIFWMLEYLGCGDVRMLDGGWDKWLADGRSTQVAAQTLPATTFTAQVNAGVKSDSGRIAYRLYDSSFAVIDARTAEEYNGWTLYGEVRGGHIPNAVNIPYAWFYNTDKTTISYQELKVLLEERGITPDKEVTAYGTSGIRSGQVYFLLRLMGYARCSNYDASILEWDANVSLPLESAPNYAAVVYPAWVKDLIDYHAAGSTTDAPLEYPYARDHKYVIFETQWGPLDDGWQDDYVTGHIPGAFYSDSDIYENGFPRWWILSDAELQAVAGSMGISSDTTVVVSSNSPIFAARLWWILKYLGVEDVRYLNGGYQQWVAAGYAQEAGINTPVPTTFVGAVKPEYLATVSYVEDHYNDGNTILSDVRTGSEYAGIISGYGYVVQKGRIPGAVWSYDADDSSAVYLNPDRSLRSYTEVRDLWKDLGIQSTIADDRFDKEVIFYCGSGYRSAVTFLQAYLMGYQNVRSFSDGWEGWSTTYVEDSNYVADPNIPGSTDGWRQDPSGRPVATGLP